MKATRTSARLDTLSAMFEAGELKMHVAASFALAHARDAQEAIGHPHPPGEIVIRVD